MKDKHTRILAAALCALMPFSQEAVADCAAEISSAGVTGFQEAVISVQDLEEATETWQTVGGFEVICKRSGDAALKRFWGLPEHAVIDEVVLKKPVSNRGLLRLVQFQNVPQVQIRSSGMAWDHGGIFDLYFYADDVDAVFAALRERGWQAYNDPVGYVLGPFDIYEVIVRGPNGEALVLMQRNAPPYDKSLWGVDTGLGWPFNSALIVRDYAAHATFFEQHLGWAKHLGGKDVSRPPGENPLGLPWSTALTAPRQFQAYANHPTDRNGSIQILHIEGVQGKDFGARAKPPNLGLLSLRVPVPDLGAFASGFTSRGGTIATPRQRLVLPPFGEVDILAVTTPEGARIEFFSER